MSTGMEGCCDLNASHRGKYASEASGRPMSIRFAAGFHQQCQNVAKPRLASRGAYHNRSTVEQQHSARIRPLRSSRFSTLGRELDYPAQPQPSCKHAEIDMDPADTSHVVRHSQCGWGGTECRSYLDEWLMSQLELDVWKERSGATYSRENKEFE